MPTITDPTQEVSHWLDICRSQMHTNGRLVKVAALGGDGQDTSFEQAFSNLAHAYLRDKAPSLLDHELGFQLLDRNQENTKAVGVFAFKVGSQMLLAPVFFLSGDLKGHELLYLKDQDMFVPMKENWINYILNRKPNILGAGVSRQTATMGVQQPDLNRLSQSPNKYAAAVIPSVRGFLPVYAQLTSGSFKEALDGYQQHCAERLDLEHFIKQASLPMLEKMVGMLQQRPKIASEFNNLYGVDMLKDAIKEAGARLQNNSILDNPFKHPALRATPNAGSILKEAADGDKGPDAKNKIEVLTYDQSQTTEAPRGLTEEEAEKLLRDEVLIKDHRSGDEVSVPYKEEVEQKLTNPPETGIYMVLVKPGDFEKCLVVVDPHTVNGRKHHCVVVRMDEGSRSWCNVPRNEVWVAGQVEEMIPGGEESWEKFYDGLPEAKSFEKGKSRYLLIGPRRNATCPFKIENVLGGSDGTKSYDIEMSCDVPWGRYNSSVTNHMGTRWDEREHDPYDPWRDGARLHLDSKIGTDLRSNQGDLYIPTGYKYLKLEATKADSRSDDGPDSEWGPDSDNASKSAPLMPGKLIDARMMLMKKTAAFRLLDTGTGFSVNGAQSLPRRETLIHLVRDHGFTQDASEMLMRKAAAVRQHGRAFECRVKYANPFLTQGAPSAPAMPEPNMGGWNPMGFNGPVMNTQEEEFVVPDLMSSNTDPSVYNVNPANMQEPMDANMVGQAASMGQKEVFDTAMIGSMLRAVRDDTMIDRYVPDLVKGMDRLGRILFMFYWHQDSFAERYGKQDLPELEDSLRNAFEMNGDVILFIKQKTIEPYPEEGVRDLDLGQAASI